MKTKVIIIIGLIAMFMSSCYKEVKIINEVGFKCEYMEHSRGLTILDVGSYEDIVIFEGDIVVNSGEIEVELINPEGETVFQNTYQYPVTINIFESYEAKNGYWRLKYKSIDGKGLINLHISEH